jgi:hypothetical protein
MAIIEEKNTNNNSNNNNNPNINSNKNKNIINNPIISNNIYVSPYSKNTNLK